MDNKKDSKKESLISRVKGFLKETEAEGKKVIWPERKYITAATGIILVIVILTTLYVMFLDFGFAKIFELLDKLLKPGF